MDTAGLIALALAALVAGGMLVVLLLRRAPADALRQAYDDFRRQRELLEAQFFTAASNTGYPKGLAWTRCDFADDVAFAREKSTGHLRALVPVTIGFEAIEGGGMEEVEAVSRLRSATSLFRHDGSRWTTDGRAVMNLDPAQTIAHFAGELEPVELPAAQG